MNFSCFLARPVLASVMLSVGLVFAGCGKKDDVNAPAAGAGEGPALTPVILQTNWYAEADHGGYYQALAKGFYREAGLDVKIQQGGPGAYQVQKVATGQVQFGLGRSDDIILAAQEGLPVVMVSSQLQHDPQIIMLHEASPVRGFADLDGRTVMVETGSAWLTYVEKKFGIRLKTIPVNYGQGAFLADKGFIQQGFLTNEPFLFQEMKVPIRFLLVSDSGYDPYRVVFTNQALIKAKPEVVRAFVRASIRGWEDYLRGDPAPGDALIAADYAQNTPELLKFARETMLAHGTADGDPAKGERLGLIARARMAEQLAILVDLGLLKQSMPVERVANFDFLPDDLQELAK